ncbi:MAG: helix-turn-helix domain-containing protein [Comamonadaceae bacterium]|nr:MAG: helix-turn-helix domain-containing protein [Comamonadaceae bacterium]
MTMRSASFPPMPLRVGAHASLAAGERGHGRAGAAALSSWPTASRTSRWRGLGLMTHVAGDASTAWVEDIFGCAAWGALAGTPGVNAAQLCESAFGHVGYCEISSLHMRRGSTAGEPFQDGAVFLWFIEAGSLAVELDDGEEVQFATGALLLSDGAQPLRAHWTQASIHCLRLPRHRVVDAVGHEAAASIQGVMQLGQLGLASFLGAQLHLLKKQGPAMQAAELDETLSMVFGTVDGLLRLALPPRQEAAPPEFADRLHAVYRYIEKNLHRHDLSVEQIALGVNSSRAQLYRLFQSRPLSVHGTLREARLLKSVEHLRSCGDKVLSIGAIAFACGFSDQSVFSKLFKQRFGITPSDLRHGQGHARTIRV